MLRPLLTLFIFVYVIFSCKKATTSNIPLEDIGNGLIDTIISDTLTNDTIIDSINIKDSINIDSSTMENDSLSMDYSNEDSLSNIINVVQKLGTLSVLKDHYKVDDDVMWSWWNYPLLIRSSGNRNKIFISFTDKKGLTGIVANDLENKTYNKVTIKTKNYGIDDHNAGAIIRLNNGKLLTAFSEGHSVSSKFYIYKSVRTDNEKEWRLVYNGNMEGTTTYSQILYINNNIYIFFRLFMPDRSFTWNMIKSTNNGESWSPSKIILHSISQQWYATFKPVIGKNNLIKFIHYSNPTLSGSSIRGGYIDLINEKVLDKDGKNIIGDIGDKNDVTKFQILIPANRPFYNRLLDFKTNELGKWNILYCKFTNENDGEYRYFEDGKDIYITEAGPSFYIPSRYYGGCIFGKGNNIYLSKNTGLLGGVFTIENWSIPSDKFLKKEIIYTSYYKLIRPVYENGILTWLEGDYNSSNYRDFSMNMVYSQVE